VNERMNGYKGKVSSESGADRTIFGRGAPSSGGGALLDKHQFINGIWPLEWVRTPLNTPVCTKKIKKPKEIGRSI